MTDRPRPAGVVVWLLRLASSRAAADAAIGDLLEELDERQSAGRAPKWRALWLILRALGSAVPLMRASAPRSLRAFGHTVRDAARALRRRPAQGLFILFILGVGIAAATVTFSVVDAVMLRPLPFDHSNEIVSVNGKSTRGFVSLSPEEFWVIHDHVAGFDSVASLMSWETDVTAGGATEVLTVQHSTAALFRVLRVEPLLGRVWTTEEETRGDTSVAVIGSRLWQRRFGGTPAVLGQTVQLDKKTYRVIGVIPDSVDVLSRGRSYDVFVPQVPPRVGEPGRSVAVWARVRHGTSIEHVSSQIKSAVGGLADANSDRYKDWQPEVTRLLDGYIKDVRGWMLLALGAVGLVVLIACVNAANVMLTRSTERAHELAVRTSLGASRRQLATSLLAESLMLSTGAGACGLLFALWGVGAAKATVAALPIGMFRASTIALNGRVFAAAIGAAIVTGVLFGTVPAWQASRASVVALLKDAGTTVTSGRRTWRSVFLVAQIASIGLLLVVSTLFVGSFIRATSIDLGVDRSHLLALSPNTPFNGTVDEVVQRLEQIPGVVGVAAMTSSSLPLVGSAFSGAWFDTPLERADDASHTSIEVYASRVTANYFDVAGISFRRGSTWSAVTAPDSTPAVIDELAARRLYGDANPLGREVRAKDLAGVFTIVGVVPYVYTRGPESASMSSIYVPMSVNAKRKWASLFVKTSGPPAALVPVVEAALAPIAPKPLSGGRSYVHVVDDAVRRMTATRRFNATLMFSFAIFAILIGAAGIYAVMASVVAQQKREIGVRIALGATTASIHRGVLAHAARHLLMGLAVGLPAGWWISRGFAALFFQVQPTDLSVYAIVAATIAGAGLVAALVPARRASRVDLIIILRAS